MVFFALTRQGYDEWVRQPSLSLSVVWVNAGILSDMELAQLRSAGVAVTNFKRLIDYTNSEAVLGAVQTIQEHHRGQRVWVEYACDL